MAINKYPKYVTTDADLWNSADESYFYVVKGKAKLLTTQLTPIIINALESGMLREATEIEINDYLLEQEIEKKVMERRIDVGKTYVETKENYFKWKENHDKIVKNKEILSSLEKKDKEITEDDISEIIKPIKSNDTKNIDKVGNDDKEEVKEKLTPTQNAINQKPSVSTKSF